MPRTRRPYSAEFRRRLVELVRGGQTPEDLARKFEPSANAIRNWVVQAARDEGRRPDGLTTDEKEEVRRLRREVRVLREEREITDEKEEVRRLRREVRVLREEREILRPTSCNGTSRPTAPTGSESRTSPTCPLGQGSSTSRSCSMPGAGG